MKVVKKNALEMHHKDIIDKLCAELSLPLSEYNFSNLFLFRKIHRYFFLQFDTGQYAILGSSYSKKEFLMPLFEPHDWNSLLLAAKEQGASYIFPLPEASLSALKKEKFSLVSDDGECDYLFEVEKIATYRGRHLDGQRNAVRSLLSQHEVKTHPFSTYQKEKLLSILDTWDEGREAQLSDTKACKEGILLSSHLPLKGMVFEVDEKSAGFVLGEPLTKDTFLLHFAKASFPIRGLYAYMYQELAKTILPEFKWMNWAQDLGIPALRHAKQEYHPCSRMKKIRLMV